MNPKQLDTPTASGPPSVHFNTIGDSIVVGLVDVNDYHQKDFDTDEPLFWNDDQKQPKMGKVVTGLVVSNKGGLVTIDDTERPAEAGELVSFWCEGGKHFTWRDAVKAAKGVAQGDVMQWAFTEEEPPKKKGFNPRKVYVATIRKPKATDGDIADRCVANYNELQNRQELDRDEGPAYTGAEEPFS